MDVNLVLTVDGGYRYAMVVAVHSAMKASCRADSYRLHVVTPPDEDLEGGTLLAALEAAHPGLTCIHHRISPQRDELYRAATAGCHLPGSICYRLDIHRILADCDRAIYLDSDVTVLQDIAPLMAVDLEGAPMGAVKDSFCSMGGSFPENHQRAIGIRYDDAYFNSGVLALDLAALRGMAVHERFAELVGRGFPYVDQDVLNVALKGRVKLLPLKYNVNCRELTTGILAERDCFAPEERRSVMEGDVAVLHYVGVEANPWCYPQMRFAQRWWLDAREILPPGSLERVERQARAYRDSIDFSRLVGRCRDAGRIVIYGFTGHARGLLDRLLSYGVDGVAAFIDRDEAKRGAVHRGVACLGPDGLAGFDPEDTLVVVAAQSVVGQVVKQLVGEGWPAERIDRYRVKDAEYYRGLEPGCMEEELAEVQRTLAYSADPEVRALAGLSPDAFAARMSEEERCSLAREFCFGDWLLPERS